MKLFGYYALHSLKNQLKKLLKTWVLIFLVACMLLGGLIGVFAARVEERAEAEEPAQTEQVEEEGPTLTELTGLETNDMIELVAGVVILGMLALFAMNADKNGSRIFLPADVNLLFPSPMKPQSVLMFRLACQLGAVLAASVYLFIQLPTLARHMALSGWAGAALVLTWCLTLVAATLVQVFLYVLTSAHAGVRTWLRRTVYGILLLVAAGYVLTLVRSGAGYFPAAARFLNGRGSRLVPLWGWLKGVAMFAVEGNFPGFLACTAALLAGCGALIFLTWRMQADFYEDAMARSEETAALLEKAQSEKTTGLVVTGKKKKDREDSLRRDGMRYGRGANVFFFKTLYNRFRFAHLHVFTKTMETYLAAALGVAAICRFGPGTTSVIPLALTMAGLSFFRSLGNPLEQDTSMDFFLLIPENTWAKLFWSLMGGTANCLLDVLPAMLVGTLVLGGSLPLALAWLPFVVSVDFYATTVGAFINLSVPTTAGKTVKQIIQIMFIYFGLLPDALLMVLGLMFDHMLPAALGSAALNLFLGFLFFGLTPLFLDPADSRTEAPAAEVDLPRAKRDFSRLGLGIFVILGAASALQLLVMRLLSAAVPGWAENQWLLWVCTFAPIYLAAVPLGLALLRQVPKTPVRQEKLSPGRLIVIGLICIFMMYAGNLTGILVTTLLGKLVRAEATNAVFTYAMEGDLLPKLLFMVILAPVIEEFIFRKTLIDRMHVYGEKLAVVLSALMFGLFHGNLSQLFYAFALGLVFGYVYVKTGRLGYSIGLHMLINTLGGIVGPLLLNNLDLNALEALELTGSALLHEIPAGTLAFVIYTVAIIVLALTGLDLLCIRARAIRFAPAPRELPRGQRLRTACCNPGMVLLLAAALALIVLSFV